MEYIYIITSPENEHFNKYKIGKTTNSSQKDLLRRYHTPLPECKILEFMEVYNSTKVEKSIHQLLDKYRIPNSEWFKGDIFLFKNVVYAECYKNKVEKYEFYTKNVVLDELYSWYKRYFDPKNQSSIIEMDEENLKIDLASTQTEFYCPNSKSFHNEPIYYSLTMDLKGNAFFDCDYCKRKNLIGNMGYCSDFFVKSSSCFEPDEEMKMIWEKTRKFLDLKEEPEIGHTHIKTSSGIILKTQNGQVLHNNKCLFHKDDDEHTIKHKKIWYQVNKQHSFHSLDWKELNNDEIILENLLENCIFSNQSCSTFKYKDGILKCDCTQKVLEEKLNIHEDIELYFFVKYDSTTEMISEKTFSVSFKDKPCPLHKECHKDKSIIKLNDEGCMYLECPTDILGVLMYGKIGHLPVVYEGRWRNLTLEYSKKLKKSQKTNSFISVYTDFVKFHKSQTNKKLPSQSEFLVQMKKYGFKCDFYFNIWKFWKTCKLVYRTN